MQASSSATIAAMMSRTPHEFRLVDGLTIQRAARFTSIS
jgi:hypothetical protein